MEGSMMRSGVRGSIFSLLVVFGIWGYSVAQAGDLHDAVMAGDVARVQILLAGGADVNEPDLNGSALHIAVGLDSMEIATALIEAGADLEAEGEPARAHPLHIAAQSNQAAMTNLLLEHGAQVDARDGQGRTPLMIAAINDKLEVAKVLLNHGADPRAQDSIYGEMPIHNACYRGGIEIVTLLLSRGVDVNSRSVLYGQTPLFYAARKNHLEVVKLLVARGADLSITSKAGATAMNEASDPAKELLGSLGLKE